MGPFFQAGSSRTPSITGGWASIAASLISVTSWETPYMKRGFPLSSRTTWPMVASLL